MNILENIQSLCQKNSISIPNLEIELGFGRGTMYRWDKSSPKVDTLQKVANYFKVSIDELTGKSSTIDFAYARVMKEAKEKGFSPKDIQKAMEFIEWSKNRDD
jgi:transcriptional regulator with XRE-family HTH domain